MSKCGWYAITAPRASVMEIAIYSEIGWFGVTAADFRREFLAMLAANGGTTTMIRVRINSLGGDVAQAMAIYYTIKGASKPTEIVIDGVAASAASLVAMAGDKIVMPENTLMMIHDPKWYGGESAEEHRKYAEVIDKIRDGMAGIYAARSGVEVKEVLAMMSKETWLTAEEAKALGFADEVVESVPIAALAGMDRYANAPKLSGVAASETKELKMTDEVKAAPAETAEAMAARITAEMTARVEEISALCLLAGKPNAIAGYVAGSLTVEAVRKELVAARTEEINTSHTAENKSGHEKEIDHNKIYAKWNAPVRRTRK